MALRPMDALGAFSYLSDNLPSWITRVSDLATHTAAKHAEYSAAFKRHTVVRPLRRKNSSICSIRTRDFQMPAKQNPPRQAGTETPDQDATTHGPASQQNQASGIPRKRGTDEVSSLNSDDGNAFVSTRHNVVIHYDGHTQTSLEGFVRNIGTARNNLRRGKMSQMARPGLRRGMLSKTMAMNGASALTIPGDGPQDSLMASIRSARNRNTPKESPFDFADKQLELAHSLCEAAAHQFLRFGDCSTELDGLEAKLKILLEMANNEVERLKEEKKQEKENAEETYAKETTEPAAAGAASEKPAAPSSNTIEVDDASSVSVESIDLSAFRANRFAA